MDAKLHKLYQDVQESHWWFQVRDNLLKDIALKYWKPGSKVLDFGSNYGHAVKILDNMGFDTWGVDVSEEAIRHGRAQNISNLILDREKKFLPESFDVIISLDVMEHIKDDNAAFQYISSLLKPGGVIVIQVPAFMFLWGVQDEVSHHFRRYTLPILLNTANKAGKFQIIKKSYFNTFLFLPIAGFRLFCRFFNIKSRDSDLNINNKYIGKMFYLIFDLERRLLKYVNLPFGVSALIILKKI